MFSILLIIIYIAFISLGLPDSLLGSAWPVIQQDLSLPLAVAGVLSMIISGGTIISSLFSGRFIRFFGTGKVTFISVTMTAGALLGFSVAPSFVWLCIAAIPLGLGAGSVDAALNNFVALHYKAKHMSWLHCFWGIGATMGPIIMSFYIGRNNNWKHGYFTISMLQICLIVVLLISLPLWRKAEKKNGNGSIEEKVHISNRQALKLPGVKVALIAFVCYCGIESSVGLWGASFLVHCKAMSVSEAARWIALFFGGITVGRFLSGFLTIGFSNKTLIRIGQGLCLIGILLLLIPANTAVSLVGLILIGIGCAPIFPSMLHETPNRFGKEVSQTIMGLQMAFAYMGATFLPPILGVLADRTSIIVLPYFLVIYSIIMIFASEKINMLMSKEK